MNETSSHLLLVAETDAETERLESLLAGLSARVEHVTTLRDALERASPELCLLDLALPDSSGIDTLHRYRSAHGDVPVITLTAQDDVDLARAALRAGAQDCLAKSETDPDRLSRAMAHARLRHEGVLEVRRNEERMRALVDAVSDLILEIDADGRVLSANRGPGDLAVSALLTHGWQAFVPKKQVARYDEMRRRVFASGEAETFETRVPNPQGGKDWYHVTIAPLTAEGPIERCAVLCRNITEERRQRDRFRRALEAAPAGMLLVDETGRIVMANRAVEELFQYDHGELLGTPVERLVPVEHAEEHVRERSDYAAAPKPRGMAGGRAVSGVTKDGQLIPLEIRLMPLTTSRRTEVLCSVADLRARRALEERFLHSQKLEAVGLLAGGIAHDFNNLLTVILAFGEFVQQGLAEDSPLQDDMSEVITAARRATSLTSQLLAFSRRQPVAPRVMNLTTLCNEMRKLLVRVIGEDVHLEVSLDDDCHPVFMDPGTMEHVLLNLAVNARDAMPGGGELLLACSNERLDAATLQRHGIEREPGSYVRLRVRDTGTGMGEETRRRVFEPFFTTKPEGRGTGLGLSTVYGLVSQANGFITVESEPGRGTTFDLWFPPLEDERAADDGHHSRTTAPRGIERILLVEDDPHLSAAAKRSLGRLGYQVHAVFSGRAALDAVDHLPPFDLVVTDLVMPDMNGAELAEELTRRVGVRLLFITGYAPESIQQRGILARGELLRKPFGTNELAAAVRRVLDREPPSKT